MKHLIFIFIVQAHLVTLLFAANQESNSIPEPFDSNVEYTQALYVAPGGSDANGTGTQDNPFRTLQRTANSATPGTQIILRGGSHVSGQGIRDLHGEPNAPILITGAADESPALFRGGHTAIQLSDPRYVILQNLVVEGSTGNGINIDDAGTFDTPAQHVILRNLTVRDIGPSGNRDGIKLSGVDHFRVEDCTIERSGSGGSAIDMVGCHDGLFLHNLIREYRSTGIQAKGGSADVIIYANRFENPQTGGRAINMGGSTGMQYFRPQDAPYEAARITVWANIFIGGETPVAFVGCEYGLFAHNTVFQPTNWTARILQENNHSRLVQSQNNIYVNNIVAVEHQVSTFVNIGPNTRPETFIFANNLYYHMTNPRFRNPNLPGNVFGNIIQKNPLFVDLENRNFHLQKNSPAIGETGDIAEIAGEWPVRIPPFGDYDGIQWQSPASIGAFAVNTKTSSKKWDTLK